MPPPDSLDNVNPPDLSQKSPDAPLALGEAAALIEALNETMSLEGSAADKARHMLLRLQELLGGDADLELILQTEVSRDPGPRIIERICVGPTFDRIEPRPHSAVQAMVDESGDALAMIIPDVVRKPRTPKTIDIAKDIPHKDWFERILNRYLRQHGWVNFVLGTWASHDDLLVMLALPQREDQPAWSVEAKRLVSLGLRAIAPILDRGMFDEVEQGPSGPNALLSGKELSGRQTDVLHLLLRGMSEKEVARELGVSTHTVHTHVKKLYTEFSVSSRGELLALFVDQRILKMTG